MPIPSYEVLELHKGQQRGIDYIESNMDSSLTGYGSSIEVHNFMSEDVYIQDRLGIVTRIPAETEIARERRNRRTPVNHRDTYPDGLAGHGVGIVHSFSFHVDDMVDVKRKYRELSDSSAFYRKILEDIENISRDTKPVYGRIIYVRTVVTIPVTDIRDADTPRYLQELGVLISSKRNRAGMYHPESLAEIIKVRSNNVFAECSIERDPARISLRAYCSTNNVEYDKLYIKLAGSVQEIPIVYDLTASFHGIVVHSKQSVDKTADNVGHLEQRYSYAEAFEKLGVSTSIHGAEAWESNRSKQEELKIAELTAELKTQAHEYSLKKLEYDRQELHHKEVESRLKREFEEKMAKLKSDQLEKDLELKRLTEEAARWKIQNEQLEYRYRQERERTQYNQRVGFETFKQSLGLAGNLVGFTLQILKYLPSK